ncbi:MAG: hypothetical protein ACU0A6_17040 [Shimia sp.]|uniref:hypothetical protein n=1 Tax=Shimia sp. TaxID=1954381 RepID=UPI004058149B
METVLNMFWNLIDIVPALITSSIMMLGLSAIAAAILCIFVALLTLRKESKSH